MRRRYFRERPEFIEPQTYREWLEDNYLAPARRAKSKNPAAFTLILILAVIVFLFICSIPCLIFGQFLLRLVMGP